MKNLLLFILLIIAVLSYALMKKGNPTPLPPTTPPPTTTVQANILITSPPPNQTVTLPFTLTGQARVFENQLNYRILENTTILTEGTAYVLSSDAGELGTFSIPITSLPLPHGTNLTAMVFDYSAKDGSEIDVTQVPFTLNPSNTQVIKVFFGSTKAAPGEECTRMYPAERRIAKTPAVARAALEELLKGVAVSEKNQGLLTMINDNVKLQNLTITSGVARADFNDRLQEATGGSCRVAAIRSQITQTLKQFPTVKNVVISINGKTQDILQP